MTNKAITIMCMEVEDCLRNIYKNYRAIVETQGQVVQRETKVQRLNHTVDLKYQWFDMAIYPQGDRGQRGFNGNDGSTGPIVSGYCLLAWSHLYLLCFDPARVLLEREERKETLERKVSR